MKILDDLIQDVIPSTIKFLESDCQTALLTDVGAHSATANKVAAGVAEISAFLRIFSAMCDKALNREEMEKKMRSEEEGGCVCVCWCLWVFVGVGVCVFLCVCVCVSMCILHFLLSFISCPFQSKCIYCQLVCIHINGSCKIHRHGLLCFLLRFYMVFIDHILFNQFQQHKSNLYLYLC